MADSDLIARLKTEQKALLRDIRQDATKRFWYLDRQVWSKKGALTRCLASTVKELCAHLADGLGSDSAGPSSQAIQLKESAPRWGESGLNWADTVALIDIVQLRTVEFAGSDRAADWLAGAALGSLKAEIAGIYLRAQADEMARQRDSGVASQHLAGRFLANASHELRTPLTAVLGFSELLLEETYGPLTDEQRTAVGHIENSAQNLHEIINNMLDLMQFRAGRLELQYRHMAAAPVLRNIYDILLPLSKRRKVQFRHEIPEDLGSMESDEGIIRHIVYHLIESALRATAEGGEVVLRAERNDRVLTIVTYDTALHFPQEAIDKMNDAYPILENSPARGYEGWEIGLPLVRRYVDLLGGTLDIESSPDAGTRIRVHLPTHRSPASEAARKT
jgi:signal transduction histidine kinase